MSQSASEHSALDDLRAEVDLLKLELTKTREIMRGLLNPRSSRFMTLRTAGRVLGLGTVRIRQLIAAGSLRTVPFPNGAIRVPRSEIEKIDALGLEDVLGPTGRKAPGKITESTPQCVEKAVG